MCVCVKVYVNVFVCMYVHACVSVSVCVYAYAYPVCSRNWQNLYFCRELNQFQLELQQNRWIPLDDLYASQKAKSIIVVDSLECVDCVL